MIIVLLPEMLSAGGRVKRAVAPPPSVSALNAILFNTKMSCSPPLALRLRLTTKRMTRKHKKCWKLAQLPAIVHIYGRFVGVVTKVGMAWNFSRTLRVRLFYISHHPFLPSKCLYPPLVGVADGQIECSEFSAWHKSWSVLAEVANCNDQGLLI